MDDRTGQPALALLKTQGEPIDTTSARSRRVTPHRTRWCVALSLVMTLLPVRASWAQLSPEEAKLEARACFDRGLRLFNQLDNAGALAEFNRAYSLIPHPTVLKNIGLVYVAMGKPVQAQEAFDRLLASPSGIAAAEVEWIRGERNRLLARIAEIEVAANVDHAQVEVDGIAVGYTPLVGTLRLSRGSHVIGIVGAGYVPLRKQVDLTIGNQPKLQFDLVPTDLAIARLELRSRIPKLEVFIDGQFVGHTPIPASLALAPGHHRLELRRLGYRTVIQDVSFGPGATGTYDIKPEVDPVAMASQAGELALAISEPGSVVFVDGESLGPYVGPLRLIAGEHLLRVEHADFFAVERTVTVVSRGRTEYAVDLKPTPNKLHQYQTTTARRRFWGWTATLFGAAVASGATGYLLWNSKQKSDAKAEFDAQVARAEPGGDCDPKGIQQPTCDIELAVALEHLEATRDRDVYGWVGAGAGIAALGLGLYLVLGNDDPERYSPKPSSDVFGRIHWKPTIWTSGSSAGASIEGHF